MKKVLKALSSPFGMAVVLAVTFSPFYVYFMYPEALLSDYAMAALALGAVQVVMWGCLGVIGWPMVALFKKAMPKEFQPLYPLSLKFCVINGPMSLARAIEALPDGSSQAEN